MDLRFGIRRAGGVGSRVVRFRGSLLAAEGAMAVYLTPGARLVVYADSRQVGDGGGCWHFGDLREAAAACAEGGGPLLPASLLDQVAASLEDDEAAG